jgi:hypothetical protein
LGTVFCHEQSKCCREGPLAKFTDPNMAAVVRKFFEERKKLFACMCGRTRRNKSPILSIRWPYAWDFMGNVQRDALRA